MFIEQLDKTRLLITLESEDLGVFDLTPMTMTMDNKNTKRLFKQILSLAAVKTGIPLKNKAVAIEILPYDSGCFLLATIKSKKRKVYRVKRSYSYFLTEFDSAGAVLDAIKRLYVSGFIYLNCSLFVDDQKYFLLFKSGKRLSPKARIILSEYGKIHFCNPVKKSHLEETCRLLHSDSAVEVIGSKL